MKVSNILTGEKVALAELSVWSSAYPLKVQDERVINFLNALSIQILRNEILRKDVGFVSLGFWLRKGNLIGVVKAALPQQEFVFLAPKGIVFHICPSNVDTIFLYSLALSLLAGNKNILRISSKSLDFRLALVFSIIKELTEAKEFQDLAEYVNLITYEHDTTINEYISEKVDVRIIWGGDHTVNYFKSVATNPLTKDICFPNRESISLINIDTYFKLSEIEQVSLAEKYYNDSYLFDQKGCSSPKILFAYSVGLEQHQLFIKSFSRYLSVIAAKKYETDITSIASLKLNKIFSDASNNVINKIYAPSNYTIFVEVDSHEGLIADECAGGYFYFRPITQLEELNCYIKRNYQTLSYFGFDMNEIIASNIIDTTRGIERIVPIGEALSFNNIWDGLNLIYELTKKIYIK